MKKREKTKKNIVVINDNSVQLKYICRVIACDLYELHAFESAEEALDNFSSIPGSIDLVITDIYMPGIDGWRLCSLLRSDEYKQFNHIPILVISATYAGLEAMQISLDIGANAFLSVPFENLVLKKYIEDLLSGKSPSTGNKILVIEDNLTESKFMQAAFTKKGYTVLAAHNIEQAKEHIEKEKFVVIISDYHLPDGTGDQLINFAKNKNSATTFIMITSNSTPELALNFVKKGADGYIQKPFDIDYLFEVCLKARKESALIRIDALLYEQTKKLIKSEERFRNLFQVIPEIILVFDREHNLIYINEHGMKKLRYEHKDIVNQPADLFVGPSQLQKFLNSIEAGFAGEALNHESMLLSKDGEKVFIETNFKLFQLLEQTCLICVAHDITDRIRTHKLLEIERSKSQYAAKMAALGEMAGGIAHEINTPLSTILNNTQFLIEDHLDETTDHDKAIEMLSIISRTVQRISKIINGMKSFSRDASKDNFSKTKVSSLLENVIEICGERFKLKRIDFQINNHLLPDVKIDCRASEIIQVLINLLNNSYDAISNQLERWIDLELFDYGDYIEITVCDSGSGISETVVDKIMQPFFTTKDVGKGIGLGLSISKGIIESHSGTLIVDSNSPYTKFIIRLPKNLSSQDTIEKNMIDFQSTTSTF